MKLTESTIEQELERFKTNDVTLSELTLAIERLQQTEQTNQAKVRKTNTFLGQLAQQLNLPGMFTLPSGRHFVYTNRGRVRTKSALPEYMTASEVQPLAQRNLIPPDARTALADLISSAPGAPPEFRYNDQGDLIPADSAEAQAQRGAEAAALAAEPAAAPAAAPAAEPADGSALTRFASSGKGGLRNDPDETEAIQELQTFLVNELGLDTGGIDSRYGPKTRSAVRQFQSALTDVVQDGDAGPETIGKISEIRTDIARIQELLNALNATNVTDGFIPVRFKSSISKLLERDLTQQERTELEQLLSKYRNFRQAFPRFQEELLSRADQVITGEVSRPNTDTRPNAATEGPFLDGMVITPDVQERLEALGRDKGMVGERLTAEDITALNAGVANGTITAPTEVIPNASSAAAAPATSPGDSAADVAQDDAARTAATPAAANGGFDPSVPAREIYVAVDGLGTDEEGVQSGLQKIANKAQWDLVDRAARSAYGEDIMQLINGDIRVEADRVQYVYPELRRIGVPHTVEVNRIRQLANVNFNTDIAPYYDAQGRFPPQGRTISNAAAAPAAPAPTASRGSQGRARPADGRTPTQAMDDRTLDLINRLGQ